MHKQVWRGAVHDDDDSYISTGKEDDSDEDDVEDDELSDDEDDEDGVAKPQKSSKSKRTGLRQEVAELNEKYGLRDDIRTPRSGEALADFYSRTSDYWNSRAADQVSGTEVELSNKELKRQGFILAKERYEELEPVLSRLAELSIAETGNTGNEAGSKDKKKEKEKKKKSNKR
jgi:hypothetical protein